MVEYIAVIIAIIVSVSGMIGAVFRYVIINPMSAEINKFVMALETTNNNLAKVAEEVASMQEQLVKQQLKIVEIETHLEHLRTQNESLRLAYGGKYDKS